MTPVPPHALLLDLDDTLINTDESGAICWREVCAEVAEEASLAADRLAAAIFEVRERFWSDPERNRAGRFDLRGASRDIVKQALVTLGAPNTALASRMAETYWDRREGFTELFPEALETLQQLRERSARHGDEWHRRGPARQDRPLRVGALF